MKRSVYVETTIPSYHFETRKDPQSVAWREVTRHWWSNYRRFYQLVSSNMVVLELQRAAHPRRVEKLGLITDLELLPHVPVIDDIVASYIENRLVPSEYGGDGYHLAYASYYEISFLLTWNCAHLANPNKFGHIRTVNERLKLRTPVICTPQQLLSDGEE